MKIKSDFVTNSSSTSFIITVESDTDDQNEFIKKFNQFLKSYIAANNWQDNFVPPDLIDHGRIKKMGTNTFVVTDFVPAHWSDQATPSYIKALENTNPTELLECGIKKVTVKEKDLNQQ